jgi:hypothetical protein
MWLFTPQLRLLKHHLWPNNGKEINGYKDDSIQNHDPKPESIEIIPFPSQFQACEPRDAK